ncbi:MAG: hypothetical protein M1837_006988 [Sclerophora amabilis]|nr:MAG: hypothetical protein M1837_006988 [Sclerophora amabilis]
MHPSPSLAFLLFLLSSSAALNNWTSIGRADFLWNNLGLGYFRCGLYCQYPLNFASELCLLNITRLPSEPIVPSNEKFGLFDPACFCKLPEVLEWTPRCLWCMDLFNLAPATSSVLKQAFGLCRPEPPYNHQACPWSCGNLTQQIDKTVVPCQQKAGTDDDRKKACLCTSTMRDLTRGCQFCLDAWNRTAADEAGEQVAQCKGQFDVETLSSTKRATPGASSEPSDLGRSASPTQRQASSISSLVRTKATSGQILSAAVAASSSSSSSSPPSGSPLPRRSTSSSAPSPAATSFFPSASSQD